MDNSQLQEAVAQLRASGADRLRILLLLQTHLEVRTMGDAWKPLEPWELTALRDHHQQLSPGRMRDLTNLLGSFCKALSHETHELEDWFPWKHWSQKSGNKEVSPDDLGKILHIETAREEVIDQLHFWLALALILGMTDDDIFNGYLAKNGINYARQDQGDY